MTIDVDLDQLAEVGLLGFSTVKLLFPSPFLYSTLRKEVIICSPYLNGLHIPYKCPYKCSTSLRVEYLHKLFGIILYTFVSSSHINLFIFYTSMDSWIFFTLCYNQILFYFFCSNCSSLAVRSSFTCLLCSCGVPPSVVGRGVCFVCLGHFLPF